MKEERVGDKRFKGPGRKKKIKFGDFFLGGRGTLKANYLPLCR